MYFVDNWLYCHYQEVEKPTPTQSLLFGGDGWTASRAICLGSDKRLENIWMDGGAEDRRAAAAEGISESHHYYVDDPFY